jgi:Reverse transcriptase (RNA-dependent DNA polymerase)
VQREGVDYNEVFAPVASIESMRIIIALAAKYNLELDQMDITGAYLNGMLDEEIYLTPPEGSNVKPGHCWRLKRSLYGLKQAGRTWNKTLNQKLHQLGFTRLNAETCLYMYRGKEGLCFLVVYVDDLLLAAASRTQMDKIKSMLSSAYKMHNLGPAEYILSMRIQRNRKARTIALSQQQYVNTVLERFGMSDCKPVFTPMDTKVRPSADDPENNEVIRSMVIGGRETTYQSIVGSLMWLTLGTRLDLAYTTGVIGRYSANPKGCHWTMAKRALRYLKATKNLTLVFDGSDVNMDMEFHGYSDANWNGDHDTSRSTSGYVFISNHGAIAWSSKLQSMVSLSSTKSEYIGLSNAGQHLVWLRAFFEEIGHQAKGATELKCDNEAAIVLSKDPQYRARTKHIQRKYHYFRDDLVAKGECIVRWCPTDDMVADILTKPLPHDKHWKFVRAMGLRPSSSGSVEKRG